MTDLPRNIDPLWTFADVAAFCQVGVRTIKRWHSEGKLPAPIRLGGSVRFDPSDIRQWARDSKERTRARVPA